MKNLWIEGDYYEWEPKNGYEKCWMLKRKEKVSERCYSVKITIEWKGREKQKKIKKRVWREKVDK